VHVAGPAHLIGAEAAVKIAAAHPNSLSGTLVATPEKERACA
jgi:hypothetical protein